MGVLFRAGITGIALLLFGVLSACGLDITFEDNAQNRDLIASFDEDDGEQRDAGSPDAGRAPSDAGGDVADAPQQQLLLTEHVVWDGLLKRHLRGACFDYGSLNDSPESLALLAVYADQLSRAELASLPSKEARVALWVNAYNALTALGVAQARQVDPTFRVDDEGFEFFRAVRWEVGGVRLSLDSIEHAILRGDEAHASFESIDDPATKRWVQEQAAAVAPFDPRLHFAINCASRSCPDLRAEAYTGDALEMQLVSQTEIFLSDPDKGAGPEGISMLFQWFAGDFESVASVPELIEMWRPGGVEGVRLSAYLPYDWSPNDLDATLSACAAQSGDE